MPRPSPLAGEHVLITGGSSGIGLAFAKSLVERNANVTLVARDAAKLAAAASLLRELDCRKRGVDPWVCTRVADVTDAKQARSWSEEQREREREEEEEEGEEEEEERRSRFCRACLSSLSRPRRPSRSLRPSLTLRTTSRKKLSRPPSKKQLSEAVSSVEAEVGPVTVLLANAGRSEPGRFVDQGPEASERAMRLNYFGALHAVRAVLPAMLARPGGRVVLVASAAGVCGFAGFTSYAPSKWALRGFGDCLRNELLGSGVTVHVAYPPDTDTPGYERESATKPPECHAASRAAGDALYSPESVAESALRSLERGRYHLSSPDLGQNLLVAAMAGLSPHPLPLVLDVLLAPILAVAMRIFGAIVDRASRRAVEERMREEGSGGGSGGNGGNGGAGGSRPHGD